MNDQSIDSSLFIKELIRRVHQELKASHEERVRAGEEAIFEVEKLELEVSFVITETAEAKGGVDFKLVTLGGAKQSEQQQLHKIVLHLSGLPQGSGSALKDLDLDGTRFKPRRE